MQAIRLDNLPHFKGNAAAYLMSPPMGDHKYVILSSVEVGGSGPETYIFPAEYSKGKWGCADWIELPGSIRGTLSHADTLAQAGYTIVADYSL